jgi:ABC-type phosphate transport system substrate-binding protein
MKSKCLFQRLALAALLANPTLLWSAGVEQTVIAVIVARQNPEQNLDKDLLARIFLRKTTFWANREAIQPVNLSATHPLRRLFSQRVSGVEPEELEAYWNDQYFHGIFPPYAVASEEAALRFVATSPAAIGYVSACAVDERVKALIYLTLTGPTNTANPAKFCPQH